MTISNQSRPAADYVKSGHLDPAAVNVRLVNDRFFGGKASKLGRWYRVEISALDKDETFQDEVASAIELQGFRAVSKTPALMVYAHLSFRAPRGFVRVEDLDGVSTSK